MKVKNEGVHCKNMMGVAWNNQLKFHLNIIHFFKKVHMLSILLHGIFMKDDVKFKVRNGTPKTLILSYGVLKSDGSSKGDHVMHFWSWIKIPIAWNSILKCS
jgi:hypothetical protein